MSLQIGCFPRRKSLLDLFLVKEVVHIHFCIWFAHGASGGYGNYVPSLKGTVILEKTVLVIYKIYDLILRMSRMEREHQKRQCIT